MVPHRSPTSTCSRFPAFRSRRGPRRRLPAAREFPPPARFFLHRGFRQMQKRPRFRNGICRWSSNWGGILRCASLMSDRPEFMSLQRRSQHDSRADLQFTRGMLVRRQRRSKRHGGAERALHSRSGQQAAQSIRFRWIFLAHRRQQQLQRAAGGRDAPRQQGLGIPRQLYVVKKSGYQFRIDGRAGQQSGADGSRSQRSATRLGSGVSQSRQPGNRFRHLRTPLRT